MPLPTCEAGHDYSLPFTIRERRGKVLVVHRVKECLGCTKRVEVFEDPEFVKAQPRIARIPFGLE
jgi:hypothetical protein